MGMCSQAAGFLTHDFLWWYQLLCRRRPSTITVQALDETPRTLWSYDAEVIYPEARRVLLSYGSLIPDPSA